MAMRSSGNDSEYDLWKKIAYNLYDSAIALGITGLNPPNWNDPQLVLMKKGCYYSAAISDL